MQGDGQAETADATSPPLAPETIRRRRRRTGASLIQESPAARLRRILVLVERFNAMASPGTDPARLIESLRNIIALACEAFEGDPAASVGGRRVKAMSAEQRQCILTLEKLSRGLPLGLPEAWRELDHAMDPLLVECVLLDAALAASRRKAASA